MSGYSAHIMARDIGKDGKCPLCEATLNVVSETEDFIRWQCSSCERTWGRQKEEEVTQ